MLAVAAAAIAGLGRLSGVEAFPPQTPAASPARPRVIPVPRALRDSAREVPAPAMQRVYDEVKTPYKYGIVLRREQERASTARACSATATAGTWCTSPSRTRSATRRSWPRATTCSSGSRWAKCCRSASGWDQWQADGSIALVDGVGRLARCSRSTASTGCRTSAARSRVRDRSAVDRHGVDEDAGQAAPWKRLEENPVLAPGQADARPFERATLYKSHVLWDKAESLGHPFVMYYNGKQQGPGSSGSAWRCPRTWSTGSATATGR